MKRFAIVCSLAVGAVTGCDTLFPGPGGGQSGSLTGIGPDGGVCEKDPQTIKNVMLAPPICNATNPCPCGTFCSSQTGGNCVADCVDDSWCAPGHFCSGYGQCLAGSADGGTGDGPGPNTDPACPRNEGLLDSLEVMNRACQFDDQCPFGSYCDHVKGRCFAACRSDAQCTSMNSPGHTFVCGCLGKCAEVGSPRVPATQVMPTLVVTPEQIDLPRPTTITTPEWGNPNQRTVSIAVVSPFVTTSGSTITGPQVTIQANPGPGLMVQCPGANQASAMPCTFTVDPSTFTSQKDGYRSASLDLTLVPSAGAPTATRWEVRLESKDLANVPKVVVVRYRNEVISAVFPAFLPINFPPASFFGSGTVEIATPTGATLAIPVKARDWGGELVLFDETQQLSPSGKLVLRKLPGFSTTFNPDFVTTFQAFVYAASDNDVVLQDSLSGLNLQAITDYNLLRDASSGKIAGTFQRAVFSQFPIGQSSDPTAQVFNASTPASFTLVPTTSSAVGACSDNNDCPSGTTCDLGFCSDLPAHRFNPFSGGINGDGTGFDTELMRHKRMNRWGFHWAAGDQSGDTSRNGHFGFYLPNSSYQSLAASERSAYVLHGPLPQISGEPLADLFDASGNVVATNVRAQAVPLVTQHDGSFQLSATDLLRECVNDLSRDRANPNPFFSGPDYETFDTYVNCINLGRVVWAMRDRQTYQHAIQGWLDVHSFVLGEGIEELRLAEATAGIPGTPSSTSPPISLERLLGVGESGLGFLIDVSAGGSGSFKNWPFENADVRPAHMAWQSCSKDADCNFGDGSPTMTCNRDYFYCQLMPLKDLPQHEQPIGVPTKILETSTAYLRALEMYLARIARQTYGQPAEASPSNSRKAAIARFGAGMRLVIFAEQLAVGINAKAPCAADATTCQIIADRFAAVRDEMNGLRQRVVGQAEAIRTGRNPFNIPEDDVPLFFGDPAGKNSQYFAASDYLLSSWAYPAVAQAQTYLDSARSSWLSQLQAKVQDEQNQHNREQEMNQLLSRYGAPILANCGGLQVRTPNGSLRQLESTEVVPYYASNAASFPGDSCFVEPSCLGNEGTDGKLALQKVINEAFLLPTGELVHNQDNPDPYMQQPVRPRAELFVHTEMCKDMVAGPWPVDAWGQQLLDLCPGDATWPTHYNPNISDYDPVSGPKCRARRFTGDANIYIQREGGAGVTVPLAAFWEPIKRTDIGMGKFYPNATALPGAPENNLYHFIDWRADTKTVGFSIFDGHAISRASRTNSANTNGGVEMCSRGWVCARDNIGPDQCTTQYNDYPRPIRELLPAGCYKGALGVERFEMEGAVRRAQLARDVLVSGTKNLDDQFQLCTAKDEHFRMVQGAIAHYNGLREAYEFEAVVVSAFRLDLGGEIENGIAMDFGFSRNDEAEHIRQMEDAFSHEEDIQACWNNYRAQQRALSAAADQIQIAILDLNARSTKFKDIQSSNRLNLEEGIAVYKREKASPLSSLAHVFWVDEKVEEFKKQFEWSRRLLFLAMRAVEFEFQQSLPFRSKIVAATTPAQLQDVVLGLQQEQAARTINRRRPDEASIVVSLRDDVLSIADRSGDPAGERNWTAADRFRSRLWDDRYAVHDSNGKYLGQGVPFTLGPTGVLETRCGERVWRATATMQGDGIESSAPGASVLLLKRNTFSSQYCNGKSPRTTTATGATVPGPQMQVGVVHTAAQLLRPGANVDLSDANEFTAALLYPWFNVRKTDFYKTGFRDGASEELAGRGLYGDYVLLFPKQVLEDGFALDKVEDVLLRLDYLSVDNLSQ